MHPALIILVWVLNFAISVWNAYAVGKAWVETKHAGGWPRVVAWAGAVMSASGFSWCYLIVLTYAAHGLDFLDESHVRAAMYLGYVVLIPGILASGMVITLDSWARTYRQTTVTNLGRTAWNTYAQIHNTFHAVGDMDTAFGSVIDSLRGSGGSGGSSSSGGSDKKGGAVVFILVFVIVMLALLSGVLTTAVIISRAAGNSLLPDRGVSESSPNPPPPSPPPPPPADT
jgi:hypothetical protein